MSEEIAKLQQQVQELLEWKKKKEEQQISYPLDIASRTALGAPYGEGAGSSSLTQSYSVVGGGGGTVTAPKAYASSFFIVVNGVRYEVPSLI